MSAARREAANYRRRGWCPIPLRRDSKHPDLNELEPYLSRSATVEELQSWAWHGVGIVTGPLSSLLVLDADGPTGEEELKKYGHPVTPMVRTASGGLHLYFKHPDAEVRTRIRIAPGLDVKGVGGYVVAPPSTGPNGSRYEWIVSPESADLADPPEWLLQLAAQPKRNGYAGPIGKRIPAGQRNGTLMSLAGTMRRRGMGEAEILAALEVTNRLRCKPPLAEEELRKIVQSASHYEPADEPWWVKVVSKRG